MRRFTLLRGVIKFLRQRRHPLVELVVLDEVLRTMSPNACANAVFTALERNPDTSYWGFTHNKEEQ